MTELPSWALWLAAGALLASLNRLLRTGHVLLALGFSCLGGAAAAAFTRGGFDFETSVALGLAPLALFPVLLRHRLREIHGEEPNERNVGRLITVASTFERPVGHFVFHFVFFCFVAFNWVAVVSDSSPSPALFAAIAAAGSVLITFLAKRFTEREYLIALWGCIGFLGTGIVCAVVVSLFRAIIHQ